MDNVDQDYCETFLARLRACADDATRVELIRMVLNKEYDTGYESGRQALDRRQKR